MTNRKIARKQLCRSQKGQAIIESILALTILSIVTIGACILLTESGMGNFYKEKMSFVTNQTAQYLLQNPTQNLDQQAKATAQQLISAMNVTVIDPTTSAKGNAKQMQVTFAGTCNVLKTDMPFVPTTMPMSDTEIATPPPATAGNQWTGWVLGQSLIPPNVYIPRMSSPQGSVIGMTDAGAAP